VHARDRHSVLAAGKYSCGVGSGISALRFVAQDVIYQTVTTLQRILLLLLMLMVEFK
jgi:hypothetical protein